MINYILAALVLEWNDRKEFDKDFLVVFSDLTLAAMPISQQNLNLLLRPKRCEF
jgi:hypothetical protein